MAKKRPSQPANQTAVGQTAKGQGASLRTYEVGALPIINHFLQRIELQNAFDAELRQQDRRVRVTAPQALLVLIRNLLLAREPLYGVGQWAARQAPDLLGLAPEQVAALDDDRLGRALGMLFLAPRPALVMRVVRRVVQEFELGLGELHNDSTTVTFFGAYSQAAEERLRQGHRTLAITHGHNKDHRPDLKQLLFILTLSDDGGVPVYVDVASGNVTDDKTHIATWELMRQLVGDANFLYVADCKLATRENMRYIADADGRFVTVLPRTRSEDQTFRKRLREQPDTVTWTVLYEVRDRQGRVTDRFSACEQAHTSGDGFPLHWYRSLAKIRADRDQRNTQIQRTFRALETLQTRLQNPRNHLREWSEVDAAMERALEPLEGAAWVNAAIVETDEQVPRQVGPGRPGPDTLYRQETVSRFHLTWELNAEAILEAERCDGVFPLITNMKEWDAESVLRAYKRQPRIEKRFAHLKSEFAVAPVWLNDVGRIEALLTAYFFVLLIESLIERELRSAMEAAGLSGLPLYPEGRMCARPTTPRVFDLFAPIQRHVLTLSDGTEEVLVTELNSAQRQVLELLGMSPDNYGR